MGFWRNFSASEGVSMFFKDCGVTLKGSKEQICRFPLGYLQWFQGIWRVTLRDLLSFRRILEDFIPSIAGSLRNFKNGLGFL